MGKNKTATKNYSIKAPPENNILIGSKYLMMKKDNNNSG